jgi:hypothetical protein
MKFKGTIFAICIAIMLIPASSAWYNGSSNDIHYSVEFGSHDWIAHQALLMLPESNRTWYVDEAITYFLQGTEAPDDENLNYYGLMGYGDNYYHHNYYTSDYSTTLPNEDDASLRAQEEYEKAIAALVTNNLNAALFYAGSMCHYIADLAVWGHVIQNETHHGDFESSANNKMDEPSEAFFTAEFDGSYDNHTAYEAAFLMGQETMGNGSYIYNAYWMDNNYQPFGFKTQPETPFDFRVQFLVDMATDLCTDVLYHLFASYTIPYTPPAVCPLFVTVMLIVSIVGLIVTITILIKWKDD